MEIKGIITPGADLRDAGVNHDGTQYWNLSADELAQISVDQKLAVFSDKGALVVDTGEFTGRSPKDRFIVKDAYTTDSVDWNDINLPFDEAGFDTLLKEIDTYLADKPIYVRDAYACADDNYRLNIRVVNEHPWANMFAYNMFLRPTSEELQNFQPDWTIVQAPGFMATPEKHGTRQHNFAIVNFTKKQIIIGGTGYTGEIKKGIFSVLNFVLPHERNILSMHCSANVGKDGDSALFFGLSGTGKTTLSADPNRGLIGDDEHGWHGDGIFNFEGGCYAKVIDLSAETEPEIYNAIKPGAILENINFIEGTSAPDFSNTEKTQNTRVSYPIHHIDNAVIPSKAGIPKNIFFLTYDAFGVLPPISRLNKGQAMYHFISGFTSKVAGTEAGVNEPQTTFSACFGAPFLPLHPTVYAEFLGKKMEANNAKVWLVNTGLTGGPYGTGKRMSLPHTRALITAALEGTLDSSTYNTHPVFGVEIPTSCPGVPDEALDPRATWADKDLYDKKAAELAAAFNDNFQKYSSKASEATLAAAPRVTATAQ